MHCKTLKKEKKVAENLLEVNTDNFKKEILDSDIPVLVDFWAEWCMPCRMISPIVEELSQDYKGKIKVAKVDVDNNTGLATDLQILSIPLLILFKDGKELTRIVGVTPKERVAKEIETALK